MSSLYYNVIKYYKSCLTTTIKAISFPIQAIFEIHAIYLVNPFKTGDSRYVF